MPRRSATREGGLDQGTNEDNKGLTMTGFYYVYILSYVATHKHHYIGMTQNLKARLAKHNSGQGPHTSKFAPWVVDTSIAVRSKNVIDEELMDEAEFVSKEEE